MPIVIAKYPAMRWIGSKASNDFFFFIFRRMPGSIPTVLHRRAEEMGERDEVTPGAAIRMKAPTKTIRVRPNPSNAIREPCNGLYRITKGLRAEIFRWLP